MFQLFFHSFQHLLLLAFFLLTNFFSFGKKIRDNVITQRTYTGLFHQPLAVLGADTDLILLRSLSSNVVFQSRMTFLDLLGCSPTKQGQEETSLLRFPGYRSAKAFTWLSSQNRLAGTKGKETSSSSRNFLCS